MNKCFYVGIFFLDIILTLKHVEVKESTSSSVICSSFFYYSALFRNQEFQDLNSVLLWLYYNVNKKFKEKLYHLCTSIFVVLTANCSQGWSQEISTKNMLTLHIKSK